MAVGMKAVGPWTKSNEKFGRCVWNCVWFVVWFNIVFAAICIALGYVCGLAGFTEPAFTVEKTTGGMLFFWAFVVGGLLAAFFQIVYIVLQKITPKVNHLHILILAWMLGAILVPFGISGALANFAGQGFSVMITVGGYNMYNVGMDLFLGHIDTALLHLGSFALAVTGLALTGQGFSVMITVGGYNMYNVGMDLFLGHIDTALLHLGSFALAVTGLALTSLFTFFIYNWRYGRTPLREVHRDKALHSLEELGYEAELTDVQAAAK